MNYDDAKKLSDDILARIRPLCIRAEVAGSVRRLKQTMIKDVEICAVPDPKHLYELTHVVNSAWGVPSMGKFPAKYTKVRGQFSIDFFWPSRETWGLIFFIRTGPAEYGENALRYWKKITQGGFSKDGVLHLADGTAVPTLEEEDVFRVLEQYGGTPCRFQPPERRIAK